MAAAKSSAGRSTASRKKRTTKPRGGKPDGLAGLAEQLVNPDHQAPRAGRAHPRADPGDARRCGRARAAHAERCQRARRRARSPSDASRPTSSSPTWSACWGRDASAGTPPHDAPAPRSRSTGSCVAPTGRAAPSGSGPRSRSAATTTLTAGQVQGRLGDLSPAALRRVRDYERRHANRKSVLASIEKALP